MEHFQAYVQLMENYILQEIRAKLPDFNFSEFLESLQKHTEELNGELFDILYSMTDFVHFKQMMIEHKFSQSINISSDDCFLITSLNGLKIPK